MHQRKRGPGYSDCWNSTAIWRNTTRRPPRRRPARLIDLVINELDSPWAVEPIRGAEDVLHDAGMGLVASSTQGRTRRARQWLDSLATRSTRGAILVVPELTPEQHEELSRLGIPYALVMPIDEPAPETTRVEVATRLVVRESSGPPPVPPAGSLI